MDTPTRKIEWTARKIKGEDGGAGRSDEDVLPPPPLTSVGRENLVDGIGVTVACEMRHQSMCIDSFQIIGGLEAYKDNIIEGLEVLTAYMREEGLDFIEAVGGAKWEKTVGRVTEVLQGVAGLFRTFAWVPDDITQPILYYDRVREPGQAEAPRVVNPYTKLWGEGREGVVYYLMPIVFGRPIGRHDHSITAMEILLDLSLIHI